MTAGRRRVVLLVCIAVAVIGLRLVGQARQQEAVVAVRANPAPTVTATPSASASPLVSASVETSGEHDDHEHEVVDPAVAAEAWVRAWMDTSRGKQAWLTRLAPITDSTLLRGLAQADLARVPVGKVKPGTRVAPVSGRADVVVRVATTTGSFDLTMTIRDEKWIATLNDVAR